MLFTGSSRMHPTWQRENGAISGAQKLALGGEFDTTKSPASLTAGL